MSSVTRSEHRNVEFAVLDSEIEQLPDLKGYLKFASSPEWRRVTCLRRRLRKWMKLPPMSVRRPGRVGRPRDPATTAMSKAAPGTQATPTRRGLEKRPMASSPD